MASNINKQMKFLCICISFYLAFSSVNCVLLTTTCAGSPTCSPAQCTSVPNSACTPTASTIDVPLSISQIPCSTNIYQSTNSICSKSSLLSIFAKGIGNGIKAVYCTDQFLIIHSDNTPNHADTLSLIPRPPGDSSSGSNYGSQCVTRARQTQFLSFKIPLNPVALSTSDTTNNVNAFLTNSKLSNVPLPKSGPVGVTVTGLPIFPAYNDQGALTWSQCEMDACNAHVGQGFDYHYHGDPYGSNCMYSSSDYASTTAHPPLIGFGMDGFKIYGRYLDQTADGYSIALDACGGHSHGTYGYHYHSQVLTQTISGNTPVGLSAGQTYTAYIAGPYNCWKGDISQINSFWDTKGLTASYGSGRFAPSDLSHRDDYQYLRPSCTMTDYYNATGVTLSVNLSAIIVTTTTTTTTTKSSNNAQKIYVETIFYIILITQIFIFRNQ